MVFLEVSLRASTVKVVCQTSGKASGGESNVRVLGRTVPKWTLELVHQTHTLDVSRAWGAIILHDKVLGSFILIINRDFDAVGIVGRGHIVLDNAEKGPLALLIRVRQ